ncbi:MAG: TetR family transcriptional regulator [Burkholderiaceae bacterium]
MSVLEARLPSLKRRPKRLRTRAQIIAAAARQMERLGYENLTVEVITESLGIARGTFYLHFRDRSHVATTVIRIYLALRARCRPRGGRSLPIREALLRLNRYYVAVYARNVQLLHVRELLTRAQSEHGLGGLGLNSRWAERVLADVCARGLGGPVPVKQSQLLLRVHGAVAMSDELLRRIFLVRAPGLEAYRDDEEAVVQALTDMWYRIIYARVVE